ncbi:hypothetical protein RHSIM_RhsimUnG0224800 [Rhododendron simsii]|uniref:Uncharacterized protein n=1 Tax=Rhododendron simsii TaxID=118357 RepID=A0A834FVN6_RHOSS|nr:hypothetical protein RHSIM_RhsimUnG0224800 [Rhododendron simsii]
MVVFQSTSPSSSHCCCCQHRYSTTWMQRTGTWMRVMRTGMWRTSMWGEVHALIFFTERRNNGELVVWSSSPSSPSFSVILNNYGGFEPGLGRRTTTAVEHVRMIYGQEDDKNNGGGWRE